MENKQKKGFLYKTIIFSVVTLFSFSLLNSPVVSKYTGISEFGSVAFAQKSKAEKKAARQEKKANKAAKAAEKAANKAEKAANKAAKAAEKASKVYSCVE